MHVQRGAPGDEAAAVEYLVSAREQFAEMGMVAALADAKALLAQLEGES